MGAIWLLTKIAWLAEAIFFLFFGLQLLVVHLPYVIASWASLIEMTFIFVAILWGIKTLLNPPDGFKMTAQISILSGGMGIVFAVAGAVELLILYGLPFSPRLEEKKFSLLVVTGLIVVIILTEKARGYLLRRRGDKAAALGESEGL